jgi:hypothetical protein
MFLSLNSISLNNFRRKADVRISVDVRESGGDIKFHILMINDR